MKMWVNLALGLLLVWTLGVGSLGVSPQEVEAEWGKWAAILTIVDIAQSLAVKACAVLMSEPSKPQVHVIEEPSGNPLYYFETPGFSFLSGGAASRTKHVGAKGS